MGVVGIQEPKVPSPKKMAVGIDLGTTHSLVAGVLSDGAVTVIPVDGEQTLLPSVVAYLDKTLVGKAALEKAESHPATCFQSMKRWIGKSTQETPLNTLPYQAVPQETIPTFETPQGPITPIHVAADILRTLYDKAQQACDWPIGGAVITVPAYFTEAQRQATQQAATLADIPVLRLISEPTAAALAYHLDESEEGTFLVYDLGGGTFDVSLLKRHHGLFEVVATGGDTALGGDDVDNAILEDWLLALDRTPTLDEQALLKVLARRMKETLSTEETVTEFWWNTPYTLTRDKLQSLAAPLIDRTLTIVDNVLKDAKVTAKELDAVVLVGGATRLTALSDRISDHLGQTPKQDHNPDTIVAAGAAQQADRLMGQRGPSQPILLDVLPLSLGLEVMGGVHEKMLARNTTLPAKATERFTNYEENQRAIRLHIVQGEREMAVDCQSLATATLCLPPLPAGKAEVTVEFSVDVDGLLHIEAHEAVSGAHLVVDIQPTHGLQESVIQQALRDAIANADKDVLNKQLSLLRVEAKQRLKHLAEARLVDPIDLLSPDEKAQIDTAMQALISAQRSESAKTLKAAIADFDKELAFYLDRRLQAGLKSHLAGTQLSANAQESS